VAAANAAAQNISLMANGGAWQTLQPAALKLRRRKLRRLLQKKTGRKSLNREEKAAGWKHVEI